MQLCGCGYVLKRMLSGYFFFFQAEDGIRDAQESRGLGDVYKRQERIPSTVSPVAARGSPHQRHGIFRYPLR